MQRSDLTADVLSHITGEKKQSQALSSWLFPEQSPRDEDGFFSDSQLHVFRNVKE